MAEISHKGILEDVIELARRQRGRSVIAEITSHCVYEPLRVRLNSRERNYRLLKRLVENRQPATAADLERLEPFASRSLKAIYRLLEEIGRDFENRTWRETLALCFQESLNCEYRRFSAALDATRHVTAFFTEAGSIEQQMQLLGFTDDQIAFRHEYEKRRGTAGRVKTFERKQKTANDR